VFHTLRSADQSKVGESIFLFLAFLHHFLAFLDKAHHAFARLGACGLSEK
jgi:hypothetical protein